MINRLVELADELAQKRKQDPELLNRMEIASQGQSPGFLLISPINRSSQDLQLFGMLTGDAFHGTRVPRMPILTPELSPVLFKGPASYNRVFPKKRGVILTFEHDESDEVVKDSLENLTLHPDLKGVPISAFHVDYETGRARIVVHGKGRSYENESWLLRRLKCPESVDTNTLVLICSDSRVQPPVTPEGLPMAIQTLGGYLPRFSGVNDETHQLSTFFKGWLTEESDKHILIIAHGNFKDEGPSCGAATASLNPDEVPNPILRPIIMELQQAALPYESRKPEIPEDRVKSLSLAIKENLLSYRSVQVYHEIHPEGFIDILLMDTVSNVLSTAEI
ncbi:MAG: hypothetical protein JW779_04170 [Candidatus Thorarchaeota archaeon]|nr:hypothetical protein [Candidatus Thorarchaeota archaeon]